MTEPDEPVLFDVTPVVPRPEPGVTLTPGERLRERQAARIAVGLHPLSYDGAIIRLHPDAGRPLSKGEGDPDAPTCGTCRFRIIVGGHARSFPKCMYGRTEREIPIEHRRRFGPTVRITTPRATSGLASDVRTWWPACTAYEPEESTDAPDRP